LTRMAGVESKQRRNHYHRSLNASPVKQPMITQQLHPTIQPPLNSRAGGPCSAHRSAKHRVGFRQKHGTKHEGIFQNMFSSLLACNEIVYDRCDECGDDDISYTYGNYSKNSTNSATTTTEESNTVDEATLDNSTILSHTLHADWETIATGTMNGPIYRDFDEARSEVYGDATLETEWDQMYHNGDDAHRDLAWTAAGGKVVSLCRSPSAGEQNTSFASRGGTFRDESRTLDSIPSPMAKSNLTTRDATMPLTSAGRSRSKACDRGRTNRARSRSLTRPKSFTRKPSRKRSNVRARSLPRKATRGRSNSERKKRLVPSNSSSREVCPTSNVDTKSKPRRGRSRSSSKEPTIVDNTLPTRNNNNASSRTKPEWKGSNRSHPRGRSKSKSSKPKKSSQVTVEKRSVVRRLRSEGRHVDGESATSSPCGTVSALQSNRKSTSHCETKQEFDAPIALKTSKGLNECNDRTPKVLGNKATSENFDLKRQSGAAQRSRSSRKSGSTKTGFFSWRKKKENKLERLNEESETDPVQIIDISAPTLSEDHPTTGDKTKDEDGLAFPVPNEEGQEIAIQDNEHCYEDPANVHSMLTMPSLEVDWSGEKIDQDVEENTKLVVVLTGNDDGTLVTDDGALYSNQREERE
jgi:hypothetical protein